jgi:hypothetical protein
MLGIDFQRGFDDAWSKIATTVPKLLVCLLILLVGWIISKMVGKAVRKLAERGGLDERVRKMGLGDEADKIKLRPAAFLGGLVKTILLFITFQTAFGVFGKNAISDLLDDLVAFVPKAVVAIVIIVITAAVAKFVRGLISDALSSQSYQRPVATGAFVAVWVIGAFAALDQVQIAPNVMDRLLTALLAIIVGVAIIAIGGGGIQPMRRVWDNRLNQLEESRKKGSLG